MAVFFSAGSPTAELGPSDIEAALAEGFARFAGRKRVLLVPPDGSRFHSRAGEIAGELCARMGPRIGAVLPALGTHNPMSEAALARMFPRVPRSLFHVHRWREDVVTLGEIPSAFIREQSDGKLEFAWPAQVNRMLVESGFDLIVSIGQVVPHEVIGMANGVKNILVGTGGAAGIDRSHYLGAVYGMERIMGRADTPVRRVLNEAARLFLGGLPLVYVLTVVGPDKRGKSVLRGLFLGDDAECFERAAALALKVNFTLLDEPVRKAVVYLDPDEFGSTWLGNKAIYRTRMALADDAELVVLAPGVHEFGEDPAIDRLIRKYGYRGTPATLDAVARNRDLRANLSAAAHLIHGSSEGRFRVTYCPGGLTREEVEAVGFRYGDLGEAMRRYDPDRLRTGWNEVAGERVFYVANPGQGLWAHRSRFSDGP